MAFPKSRDFPEPSKIKGARWIPLTQNKFALVDEEDYPRLIKWPWCFDHGYAARKQKRSGVQEKFYMHRVILGNPSFGVDHINGDRLDNRKSNLRLATQQQNSFNRGPNKNNTSGFKGVYWNGQGKWTASITINRKFYFLGNYDSPEEAATAYLWAAYERFGDFVGQSFSTV